MVKLVTEHFTKKNNKFDNNYYAIFSHVYGYSFDNLIKQQYRQVNTVNIDFGDSVHIQF